MMSINIIESVADLGDPAKLLGVSPQRISDYRYGTRSIPNHVINHALKLILDEATYKKVRLPPRDIGPPST